MNRVRLFIMVVATDWLAVDASAQVVNVTPAKGQSTEQMQKDVAECQGLACPEKHSVAGESRENAYVQAYNGCLMGRDYTVSP